MFVIFFVIRNFICLHWFLWRIKCKCINYYYEFLRTFYMMKMRLKFSPFFVKVFLILREQNIFLICSCFKDFSVKIVILKIYSWCNPLGKKSKKKYLSKYYYFLTVYRLVFHAELMVTFFNLYNFRKIIFFKNTKFYIL